MGYISKLFMWHLPLIFSSGLASVCIFASIYAYVGVCDLVSLPKAGKLHFRKTNFCLT